MDRLSFENQMVLTVVQAALGAIVPAVQAIAISTDADRRALTVHVAADGEFEDPDFLADLLFEIDALTGGSITIDSEVWRGPDWTSGWPGAAKRVVYAAWRRQSGETPGAQSRAPFERQ